jgi:hypothetical protein
MIAINRFVIIIKISIIVIGRNGNFPVSRGLTFYLSKDGTIRRLISFFRLTAPVNTLALSLTTTDPSPRQSSLKLVSNVLKFFVLKLVYYFSFLMILVHFLPLLVIVFIFNLPLILSKHVLYLKPCVSSSVSVHSDTVLSLSCYLDRKKRQKNICCTLMIQLLLSPE